MGFNENRFISPLFKLFGKRLAKVPPSPINNDIIVFNVSTNEWELKQSIIGSAVQSSSNVGIGDGLALPRVLDDLPFKTLVDGVEIVITVSATELTFSIGAIAISKITGLQVILDSKIESLTNVGGFNEIAKAKVGTNVDLRTLQAGTNITITQNANDLEISASSSGEDNTASNVGTGVDVFLQKIGVDLEFRTLLANAEILITQNALDLAFSIGAIAQAKITGLVTALLTKIETITNIGGASEIAKAKVGTNVDLRTLLANAEILITTNVSDLAFSIGAIAQAKITGLVTALASKLETIANVGTGAGLIFRDKVGVTANLKSLLAGTGISITNNADDIEISATGGTSPPVLLQNCNDTETIPQDNTDRFLSLVGEDADDSTEINKQTPFVKACKLANMGIHISVNASTGVGFTFKLRINGVDGNLIISVGAGLTGFFQDTVNQDDIAVGDLVNYVFNKPTGGDVTFVGTGIEVLAP